MELSCVMVCPDSGVHRRTHWKKVVLIIFKQHRVVVIRGSKHSQCHDAAITPGTAGADCVDLMRRGGSRGKRKRGLLESRLHVLFETRSPSHGSSYNYCTDERQHQQISVPVLLNRTASSSRTDNHTRYANNGDENRPLECHIP